MLRSASARAARQLLCSGTGTSSSILEACSSSGSSSVLGLSGSAAPPTQQRAGFKSVPKKVLILLNQDVVSLGRAGDQVEVKQGHAYNYLIPTKKATLVKIKGKRAGKAASADAGAPADADAPERRTRTAFVSASTAEAREKRAVENALDAVLRKVLTTTVKFKVPVLDAEAGTLQKPIGVEEVCEALKAQARVAMHPALLSPPPGGRIATVGSHELPLNVVFPAQQEGVVKVQVTPAARK